MCTIECLEPDFFKEGMCAKTLMEAKTGINNVKAFGIKQLAFFQNDCSLYNDIQKLMLVQKTMAEAMKRCFSYR